MPSRSKAKLSFIIVLFVLNFSAFSQVTNIEWQKCFGGSWSDWAAEGEQTQDGGYIVAGVAESLDGDALGNHGGTDFLILKLDSWGNIVWQKCLGGSGYDYSTSIEQTSDGGFVVGGIASSIDGDVDGNHDPTGYEPDCWIIKLDSAGNIEWKKCLGGSSWDGAYSIEQVADGGYIVAAAAASDNGDVTGSHGECDCWIVKLDNAGEIEWQKTYGGTKLDYASSVHESKKGGYIFIGSGRSEDGDFTGHLGSNNDDNLWVIRLDSAGNILWKKNLGVTDYNDSYTIMETVDAGYIVTGQSISLVKLDSIGDIQWKKIFDVQDICDVQDARQTSDGGYIVVGDSWRQIIDWPPSGDGDFWIGKTDNYGNLEWQDTLGGSGTEYAYGSLSIKETLDGGFLLAGETMSNDEDVSGNHGDWDVWVVKLSAPNGINEAGVIKNSIEIYPNPFSSLTTITLSLGENAFATIELFDLTGRKFKTLLDENVAAGDHKLYLNGDQLSSGLYFLQLKMNGEVVTKKIIIE
ncbi:MAG TPA: T9SS type A sorting domain-containing protein [Chitinophagales bacterium]|nr:T9SS type A sorting domain-containing protein [Chitinophagales bacterium]